MVDRIREDTATNDGRQFRLRRFYDPPSEVGRAYAAFD